MADLFVPIFSSDLLLIIINYMNTMDKIFFLTYLKKNNRDISSNIQISQRDSIPGLLKQNIKSISYLNNLKYLDLGVDMKYLGYEHMDHKDIDDESMLNISKLTNLTFLSLNNKNKITTNGLILLAKLTNLRSLELSRNLLSFYIDTTTKFNFQVFTTFLTNLTSLNLSCSNNLKLEYLTDLVRLQNLNLKDCYKLNPNDLYLLEQLPELKSLNLSNVNSIENFDMIGRLTNLTFLDISDVRNIFTYDPLSNLTKLEILYLYNIVFDNANFLYYLTQLRDLNLFSYESEIDDLTPLIYLTNLEKLIIRPLDISSRLRYLTNLKYLEIGGLPTVMNSSDISLLTNLEKNST